MARKPKVPAGKSGDRLKKSALLRRLEIDRKTLDKYLRMVGAPPPDGAGRYEPEAVIGWIAAHSPSGIPATLAQWKIEEIRLRCEKMKDSLTRDRGEYISRVEAAQTIEPLMVELGQLMRQKFVMELPSRYKGKDTVDCQLMNEAAVDVVIQRFREGAATIAVGDKGKAAP